MKLRDLIDVLTATKPSSSVRDQIVKHEILENMLAGTNGVVDLNAPVQQVAQDVLAYEDCWIIFTNKNQRPKRVFVVEKDVPIEEIREALAG